MGLWIGTYQADKDGRGPEGRRGERIQQWITPGYHYRLRRSAVQGALVNEARNTLAINLNSDNRLEVDGI